ncbi:hypothetical protein KAH43_07705, partial [Candidatus Bipolaricaulota bacterium]|nr:hypothetical protein [Candidatus Bipolaricaulota bacterium]
GIVPLPASESALLPTPQHLATGVYTFTAQAAPRKAAETAPDYDGYFTDLLPHVRNGTLSTAATSLDLARVLALGRSGASLHGLDRIDGDYGYSFLIGQKRAELQENYVKYLNQLRSSGQLDDIIRRHFS